jgi:ureidoacrylate peracid hydrolase
MHRIAIPPYAVELTRQRVRALKELEWIASARTALLVVDMQNAFVAPTGAFTIAYAREIVGPINRIANALRAANGRVVWIQTNFRDEASRWSVWFNGRLSARCSAAMIAALTPGAWDFDLCEGLATQPDDLHCVKTRFSPFVKGASDLDDRLAELGIDTVIVTGTVTNTCCESTARDAMMLNYRTIFVSDGNAARTDEEHNATLGNMVQTFADVMSTDEVISSVQSGAK